MLADSNFLPHTHLSPKPAVKTWQSRGKILNTVQGFIYPFFSQMNKAQQKRQHKLRNTKPDKTFRNYYYISNSGLRFLSKLLGRVEDVCINRVMRCWNGGYILLLNREKADMLKRAQIAMWRNFNICRGCFCT